MTLTGEYTAGGPQAGKPTYPTVFGLTFTPTVSGVLLGAAGLGLAAFLASQFIGPALEQFGKLNASIDQKRGDLAQKAETVKQVDQVVASVKQAKDQNKQVRALFSTQKELDTLLLDLNRVIGQNQGELLKFEPDYATSGIVTDGSVGAELNGKIKRQVTNVSFQGTFAQTLGTLQTIDRLQTLLVVNGLVTEAKATTRPNEPASNLITSTFKLIAYVPLTPEELAAAPPPPAADAKK
jgi:type IV pilus assembly protein PilO